MTGRPPIAAKEPEQKISVFAVCAGSAVGVGVGVAVGVPAAPIVGVGVAVPGGKGVGVGVEVTPIAAFIASPVKYSWTAPLRVSIPTTAKMTTTAMARENSM
jgi:hypothetical protein